MRHARTPPHVSPHAAPGAGSPTVSLVHRTERSFKVPYSKLALTGWSAQAPTGVCYPRDSRATRAPTVPAARKTTISASHPLGPGADTTAAHSSGPTTATAENAVEYVAWYTPARSAGAASKDRYQPLAACDTSPTNRAAAPTATAGTTGYGST